jgi:hypothetical protein
VSFKMLGITKHGDNLLSEDLTSGRAYPSGWG